MTREELFRAEFDWFARDQDGHLACMVTGGSALLPDSLVEVLDSLDELRERFPIADQSLKNDFSQLAQHGLYIYDTPSFSSGSYRRRRQPPLPLLQSQLDPAARFNPAWVAVDGLSFATSASISAERLGVVPLRGRRPRGGGGPTCGTVLASEPGSRRETAAGRLPLNAEALDGTQEMYEGGRQERWETPFSEAQSLVIVSIVDAGPLVITLEDARHPARLRYRVTFEAAPLYRNIWEEYRLNEGARPIGSWSVLVRNSGWLEVMRRREPLLDVHSPGLGHYQIITEDDVLDILSNTTPEVEELGPAPPGAPPAGKSRVLYHPEDREEIDRLIEEINRGK